MRTLQADVPLTESAEERDRRDSTYQGQAGWAHGPHVCCHCKFFQRRGDRGSCKKAKKLMGLARGKYFPCSALSCNYFVWQRRPGPKGRHLHANP